MKHLFLAALVPLAAITAVSQDNQAQFQTPAMLIENDGAWQRVWIVAATPTDIRYRENEVAMDLKDAKIADFASVYMYEPADFAIAMDLYQGRKYAEAKEKFAAIKELFKPMITMPGNFATLAGFYEMECMRRLGDLAGLNEAFGRFIREPLTRENHLRQLELYPIWEAVRAKEWKKVEIVAKEREVKPMPGEHLAQIAYCRGLALEALERPQEALYAYGLAMTADAGASEDLARQATLRVLAIHTANADVRIAMKLWGTDDEDKNSRGYSDLVEAAAVAYLYQIALGAGTPLPPEYKPLLKYKLIVAPSSAATKDAPAAAKDAPKEAPAAPK